MTEYKLNKNSKYIDEIKRIYHESFPWEERAPFFYLLKNCSRPGWDFTYYVEDDNLVGISLVLFNETHALLQYLATNPQIRSKGIGSRILTSLKEKYKDKTLFLSLETQDEKADNALQRQKRHAFYIRNGLRDMRLRVCEGGVDLDIMGIGEEITSEAYLSLMDQFTGPGGFLLRLFFRYKALLPEE